MREQEKKKQLRTMQAARYVGAEKSKWAIPCLSCDNTHFVKQLGAQKITCSDGKEVNVVRSKKTYAELCREAYDSADSYTRKPRSGAGGGSSSGRKGGKKGKWRWNQRIADEVELHDAKKEAKKRESADGLRYLNPSAPKRKEVGDLDAWVEETAAYADDPVFVERRIAIEERAEMQWEARVIKKLMEEGLLPS